MSDELLVKKYKPDGQDDEIYCDIGEFKQALFLEGAKAQLAKLRRLGWKSPKEVEEVKVRGLEAGKAVERERIERAMIEGGNIVDHPTKSKRSLLILLPEFHKALKDKP